MTFKYLFCLCLLAISSGPALAAPAPFDLAGPTLEVKVTRAGVTLPISQAPDLSTGDQLWIKADLPPTQSVHYLLVATFLRGATNPPPESWFHQWQTWNTHAGDWLRIAVPQGAQQALVFLAPQTGGDFKTLVNAVRGRPGAFVRASQDLNQATLDRARLDAFLNVIRRVNAADQDHLKAVSPLLARSLAIKLNADCLGKEPGLQASCLMQGEDALVLDDGPNASVVQSLTSGNSAQLIGELSSTRQAGYGFYSPYVGAVMDMARIVDSLQTAHYQYLPALTTETDDRLSLLLNTPPSFQDPKSVLMAALPAIETPPPPALQPVEANATYCAEKPGLVLPVDGAPLAFSTGYAHDLVLRLEGKGSKAIDAAVKVDAEKGGLVVDTTAIKIGELGEAPDATLHGFWGFAPFDGPHFHLQNTHPESWALSADDQLSLIAGRDDTVDLRSPQVACVEDITIQSPTGEVQKVDWKSVRPGEMSLTLPLAQVQPGPAKLLIKRYGDNQADVVSLQVLAQAGRLDGFALYVGEPSGVLKGARLDEVASLNLHGVVFTPDKLTTIGGADELSLVPSDARALSGLKVGESMTAKVTFKDGRNVGLKVLVQPPRPSFLLISKGLRLQSGAPSPIKLSDQDEVPLGAVLTFSIRAQPPTSFTGHESVQVANASGAILTTLTSASGLVLEDTAVAVATLDTGKALNASTFGQLQFRVVGDGVASDWRHLANLVRLPTISRLKCPAAADQPCELMGSNLFLLDAVSSDGRFDHAVKVPEGFTGDRLEVPHPSARRLYVKLHDDPSAVDVITPPA